MRVIFVVGTRPEIIKISPVVKALRQTRGAGIDCRIVATGQHDRLAEQAFADVGLVPDCRLAMRAGALSLMQTAAAILDHAQAAACCGPRADLIVVQGDTNSALAGAMAGFDTHNEETPGYSTATTAHPQR
ncbi:MAG: hypothetical protein D6782_12185, partial [Alphaproteobacteria bacterium]